MDNALVVERVCCALRMLGWREAGETEDVPVYRRPDRDEPIRRSDGSLVLSSGRKRFKSPNREYYITVGPVTICIYRCRGGKAFDFCTFKTKQVVRVLDTVFGPFVNKELKDDTRKRPSHRTRQKRLFS